jgi:hypothetical protein
MCTSVHRDVFGGCSGGGDSDGVGDDGVLTTARALGDDIVTGMLTTGSWPSLPVIARVALAPVVFRVKVCTPLLKHGTNIDAATVTRSPPWLAGDMRATGTVVASAFKNTDTSSGHSLASGLELCVCVRACVSFFRARTRVCVCTCFVDSFAVCVCVCIMILFSVLHVALLCL